MFIYSLPILFAHIQFGTPTEYAMTILFVLALLFIVTPTNPFFEDITWGAVSDLTLYQYLFDAWNGHIKLWLVFWPFFILLNIVLFAIDNFSKAGVFTVSSWDAMHFILFTPVILWTINVWRNSLNTASRYWAVLARLMTLAVFFEYGLKLVIRQDYARLFFECQDAILDYVACF